MTDHPYAWDEPPETESPEEAEVTELGERNMESDPPDEPQAVGPVEVASAAVHARWIADGEMGPGEPGGPEMAFRDMEVGFKAAHEAGWSLVRIGECPHPPTPKYAPVHLCDCRTVRITEEWP